MTFDHNYGGADYPWTDCTEIKLAMQLSVLPVINGNNTMAQPQTAPPHINWNFVNLRL